MNVKKIVVIGASGQIGLKVCDEAVKRGIMVRAFSRDPSLYPQDIKSKVEVMTGDITNPDDINAALASQDAVVVTLGTRNDLGPTTTLSTGIRNIIEAMKIHGIHNVSVCLSAFLFYEKDKVPVPFQAVTAEHQRMFDLLKNSEVNWIAVFPPHFTDSPSCSYIVKHGGLPGGRSISKIALASFMIDCLHQSEHYKQVCGISQKEDVVLQNS